VEATIAAYATQQAASDESLTDQQREAAAAAALATRAALDAQATIAALETREAELVLSGADLAALATQNASLSASDLATAQAVANANATQAALNVNQSAADATQIADLRAQQANAQVTATALAVVAANSVLDPNQQNITIQTNLGAMLGGDEDALQQARQTLNTTLSRYPPGCRAGFALISGNAPDIDQGIQLARQVESLLREVRPDIFTEDTGFEHFAQPGVDPFGEVTISVFYYSGCEPIT
jgi:hypothetical protein